MGSNLSTVYWMYMTFFHIDLLLKLWCLFEKTKNKWLIFKKTLFILPSGPTGRVFTFQSHQGTWFCGLDWRCWRWPLWRIRWSRLFGRQSLSRSISCTLCPGRARGSRSAENRSFKNHVKTFWKKVKTYPRIGTRCYIRYIQKTTFFWLFSYIGFIYHSQW